MDFRFSNVGDCENLPQQVYYLIYLHAESKLLRKKLSILSFLLFGHVETLFGNSFYLARTVSTSFRVHLMWILR